MTSVLAIEDDPTTAREIVSELSRRGFEVCWVAEGREGLVRAVSGEFDAVTLDRMLPGVDGLTIVSVMRSAGERCRKRESITYCTNASTIKIGSHGGVAPDAALPASPTVTKRKSVV